MKSNTVQAMAALDASKDETSTAIKTAQIFYASIQVVMTGSSTGTLKVQVSNDIPDPTIPTQTPTNWSDLSGATITPSAGSLGLISLQNLCYGYIRLVWTHNNGSAGTITANVQLMGN